jgi:23S rRNA (cytidine1920-2'-O)/16S rRNA (cytidine1409-2'-O)-methyltransferase
MVKRRVDSLLVQRGLAESREKARAAILAGDVLVGETLVAKPGTLIDETLDAFAIGVEGLTAVDVGASTGGFTDCLLQRGARRVYAVDVGYGQLDYRLRQDARVVVMERVNARYLRSLPEEVDLATVDVSFIGLETILPAVARLLKLGAPIVALFKPQFQARKGEVGKGGVVRDPLLIATLIGRFVAWAVGHGIRIRGLTPSPLLGPAGNQELFLLLEGTGVARGKAGSA